MLLLLHQAPVAPQPTGMQAKDWIPVVGWFVVFGLGIVSGGWIVPRLTRKRKILSWGVVTEAEIVPRELSKTLGVEVVVQVGAERPSSLTTVTIAVGCTGNEVLEDFQFVVRFGTAARILNARAAEDLGEFAKHISWMPAGGACAVTVAFLNPKQSFSLEFLVSEYEAGGVEVDAAAPGLEIRRSDPSQWNVPTSILRGLKVSFLGVGYEPGAVAMGVIAEELKAIRRSLRKVE